jgi:hypothetical protein
LLTQQWVRNLELDDGNLKHYGHVSSYYNLITVNIETAALQGHDVVLVTNTIMLNVNFLQHGMTRLYGNKDIRIRLKHLFNGVLRRL